MNYRTLIHNFLSKKYNRKLEMVSFKAILLGTFITTLALTGSTRLKKRRARLENKSAH